MRVAWVLPLRGETKENILANLESTALEPWLQFLFRGARIRRALERDQLSRTQIWDYRFSRIYHERKVGFPGRIQRSRHADYQGITFTCSRELCRCFKPPGSGRCNRRTGKVYEVAPPRIDSRALDASISNPITRIPTSENRSARGSPT